MDPGLRRDALWKMFGDVCLYKIRAMTHNRET